MRDDADQEAAGESAFEIEASGECPRCELGVTATLLVLAGATGRVSELVECPSCGAAIELVVDIPTHLTKDALSTDLSGYA
jgi:hypothetical protein